MYTPHPVPSRLPSDAIQAAIRVLLSVLPKSTWEYVTSPPVETGDTPSSSTDSVSVDDEREREREIQRQTSTVKNITQESCVVAFVSVSSKDSVPEAAFIRDLSILMDAYDVMILDINRTMQGVGVEKIKGTQESLIVRVRYSGPETPGVLTPQKGFDARVLYHLCLYAQLTLTHFRQRGVPLETIVGVRAGVASGSVTSGVLGSQELMYDIFGDCVNTAARLMQNGSPWDVLVTERTANSVMTEYPKYHTLGLPEAPFAPRDFTLSFSNRLDVSLKGKGLVPVRIVCFSSDTLREADRFMSIFLSRVLTSTPSDAQGGINHPHDWISKLMAPARVEGEGEGERDWVDSSHGPQDTCIYDVRDGQYQGLTFTDTPHFDSGREVGPNTTADPSSLDTNAVSAILHAPWDVINASFMAPLLLPKDKALLHSVPIVRMCSRDLSICRGASGYSGYSGSSRYDSPRGVCDLDLDTIPEEVGGGHARHPNNTSTLASLVTIDASESSSCALSSRSACLETPVRTSSVPHAMRRHSVSGHPSHREKERERQGGDQSALSLSVNPSPMAASLPLIPVNRLSAEEIEAQRGEANPSLPTTPIGVVKDGQAVNDGQWSPQSETESDSSSAGGAIGYCLCDVSGSESDGTPSSSSSSEGLSQYPCPMDQSQSHRLTPSGSCRALLQTATIDTDAVGVEAGEGEREREGGREGGRATLGSSISSRIAVLDRALIQSLQSLTACVPEGSPLFRLSDGLRGVTSALMTGKERRGRGRGRVGKRILGKPSRTRTLGLLLLAVPQAVGLVFNHSFVFNDYVVIDTLHKMKAQLTTGLTLFGLEALVVGFLTAYLCNNLAVDTYPILSTVYGYVLLLRAMLVCFATAIVLRIGSLYMTYTAGVRACLTATHSAMDSKEYSCKGRMSSTSYKRVYKVCALIAGRGQYFVTIYIALCVWAATQILRATRDVSDTDGVQIEIKAVMCLMPYLIVHEAYITLFSMPTVVTLLALFFSVAVYIPTA
ncbi:hypothetical protein KIPB_004295, partial [Kipferlia bialata]|eukprot:g4295.t1